jgi:hypothetical protein
MFYLSFLKHIYTGFVFLFFRVLDLLFVLLLFSTSVSVNLNNNNKIIKIGFIFLVGICILEYITRIILCSVTNIKIYGIYVLHTMSGIVHFAICTVIYVHIANCSMLLNKVTRLYKFITQFAMCTIITIQIAICIQSFYKSQHLKSYYINYNFSYKKNIIIKLHIN